jgi:hypothetical protein
LAEEEACAKSDERSRRDKEEPMLRFIDLQRKTLEIQERKLEVEETKGSRKSRGNRDQRKNSEDEPNHDGRLDHHFIMDPMFKISLIVNFSAGLILKINRLSAD